MRASAPSSGAATTWTGRQTLSGGLTTADLIFSAATELTIATGAVTATQGAHTIDTEGDAASDDLDTIAGGTAEEVIFVRPANSARTVVLKHAIGSNRIACPGGLDISLAESTDWAMLVYNGTQWTAFDSTLADAILSANNAWLGSNTFRNLLLGTSSELTIASGAIAATRSFHTVDTESDGASDDLDDVTGGNAGEVLLIKAENSARTVVIRHAIGANKIATPGARNISLAESTDWVLLVSDGTQWTVVAGSTLADGLLSATNIWLAAQALLDTSTFEDPADRTKKARIDAGTVGAGQTRVLTMPNADVTMGAYAPTLLNVADEAAFKAAVNLEIGTDVQAQDAELAAIAGLTSAANKSIRFTGSGTAEVVDNMDAAAALGASTAATGDGSFAQAAELPAGTARVYPTTAADGTKAVKVHANDKVTGRTVRIGNKVSNQILKVFGPSGANINGLGADTAFSSVSGKGVVLFCEDSGTNLWLAW